MKLKPRDRYKFGDYHIRTGLYGGWWHDDHDGAPDAGDHRAGNGMGSRPFDSFRTTFHEALCEIAEMEAEAAYMID